MTSSPFPRAPEPSQGVLQATSRQNGPHARLDPYGIYGTRSANRQHFLKRKRKLQGASLVLLALVLISCLPFLWKWVSVPRGAITWSGALPGTPAAAPALAADGSWLVPCTNGTLVRLVTSGPDRGASQTVFSIGFPLQSTPVVRQDFCFVPSQDGTLYAVNWQQRRLLWSYRSGASITGSPALGQTAGGARVVFIGNDDGKVVALNGRTGVPLWGTMVGGPVGNGLAIVNQGKRVLVPVLPGVAALGGLVCLDGATGRRQWSFPANSKVFGTGLAPPAVTSGPPHSLFFGTEDGVMVRMDSERGTPRAPAAWKSFAGPRPETALTGQGFLAPLEVISLRTPPLVAADGLSVLVGGNDGGMRCFGAEKGELRWVFRAGAPFRLPAKMWVHQGRPYYLVAAESPYLWALNGNGEVERRWKLDAVPLGFEVMSQEILVAEEDGNLKALSF